MALDNDKEFIVDATEVALVTGGAIVGGSVGAGLSVAAALVSKLARSLERRTAQRQTRFLEMVGNYLDANDPHGAATFVDQAVGTDEFADVLERGYERMRRSYDPLAEECICLLTAEHLRVGRPSAREYVAAGALLEASDAPLLLGIHTVVSAYFEAASQHESTGLILFDSSGIPQTRGPFFFVVNYARGDVIGRSERIDAPPTLKRALTMMDQHGFGSMWHGMGAAAPEDLSEGGPSCRHDFASSDRASIHLLGRCLTPVGKRRAA
jgi:hypothetical protein